MINFTSTVVPATQQPLNLKLEQILKTAGVYENRYGGYLVVMPKGVILLVTDGVTTTPNIYDWKDDKFRKVEADVNVTIKLK